MDDLARFDLALRNLVGERITCSGSVPEGSLSKEPRKVPQVTLPILLGAAERVGFRDAPRPLQKWLLVPVSSEVSSYENQGLKASI